MAAMAVALYRPARAHVRAASLLDRFADASAPAPAGIDERAIAVDGPDGPIRARTYAPRGGDAAPCIVLVHGVHHLGIDEPRLVRFARAMATSGATVLTPEVRELTDYRVDAASPDVLGAAAHALHARCGAPVGLMGMSFAGGLSLLAAADARWAPDVGFVVAVGAHDDLARVSRFFATNAIARADGSTLAMQAHPYGPLVLVYAHVEDFFAPEDVPAARDALRLWLWEERDAARARARDLSEAGGARIERLFTGHVDAIAADLLADVAKHAAAMDRASPHGHLAALRAPVFLLHGAGDSVIPATETGWLARDLPPGLLRDELVSPAVVHVAMEAEPTTRDKWALVHFMAEVLEAGR